MDYCEGYSLDILLSCQQKFTERKAIYYVLQLSEALKYLYVNHIIFDTIDLS